MPKAAGCTSRPRDIDTADLLEGVSVRFGARVRASGRTLVVDPCPPAHVTADLRRIEQALGNLVENALRYGDGRIHLGAAAHDDTIALFVRDEGPGFPPEFVDQAFERFTRADHARSRGGAGLGLSIVEAIARAHGGEAHAANDPRRRREGLDRAAAPRWRRSAGRGGIPTGGRRRDVKRGRRDPIGSSAARRVACVRSLGSVAPTGRKSWPAPPRVSSSAASLVDLALRVEGRDRAMAVSAPFMMPASLVRE